MKKCLVMILMCILLAGCMFRPRSSADFPASLHTLYFSPEKPYSILSVQFHALLESINVVLTKKSEDADFSIEIKNDNFSYARPQLVDATLPSTIGFSQTATITILDTHSKKVIATQTFTTNESLTLNSNQIYTANSNDLVRQQLNHELVSLIYYWLVSKNMKDALTHADHGKTAINTAR